MNSTSIGTVTNYYGGVRVFERDGKCYWYIENWDSDNEIPENEDHEEIPRSLYDELIQFQKSLTP